MNASELLSASVGPVVLISACGLLVQALYNRLAAILGRMRAFQQQKLELLDRLHERDPIERQMLVEMFDSQIEAVTIKAKTIQKGLTCLLSAIGAFLCCALLTGATALADWFGPAAITVGVVGVLCFFAGLGWAMRELRLSVAPLEEENAVLATLSAHRLNKFPGANRLKVADSA